jgi:glycosyltransferase involved in cell wall biosynthesis
MDGSNPYRKIALELQARVDAMHHSRAWQLTLAFGLARRSFRELLRLPGRVWRILSGPAEPARVAHAYGPEGAGDGSREPSLSGWPASRPLVSVAILSTGISPGPSPGLPSGGLAGVTESLASLHESTLRDFEVILVVHSADEAAGMREAAPGLEGCFQVVEALQPDSPTGRNKAVELAEGKYVVLLRAGDRLDPTFLEKTAYTLEGGPGFGFAYAKTAARKSLPPPIEPFGLRRALRYNHVPDSALFRRDAWVDVGGFRAETKFDLWDFWVAAGTVGWAGLLLREELIRLGPESLQAESHLRDTARDSREIDTILQRHAALLETPRPPERPANSQPRAAPGGPRSGQTIIYPRRQFLNFSADKPAILCVVPWLNVGGAEKVVLQILRGLSGDFSFAVAATLDAEHNRADEFRTLTPWVYHLPASSAADPGRFLAELAEIHGVRGVVISSSEEGYRALPAFKQRGLWTADIVHNTAPEGHLDQSISLDSHLDFHFACGREQAEALRNGTGAGESRVRTVWTAVDAQGEFDPTRYEARRETLRGEFGLDDRDVVIAYVGRLSMEKDVPLFVAAVAEIVRRHPGIRIRALVAGDGMELLRVEQAIEREGLWNEVRLLGDTRRVPEILALSDYLLLTSKTEGSPITILEAMSLEVVVLSTAVGNVRDVIEDGVNGFVIGGRDPATFADRFDAIRRDPERERRMREAARRTILDRFDEPQLLKSYADVFRAALGPDGANRSV